MSSVDAAPASSPTPQLSALLGDSGRLINDLLDSVLTSEGWNIERVSDNQAILFLAIAKPFDLIITAAKSGGPEDLDLLRKIRRVRRHIRLIILTDEWTPGDV